ncbi:uncharacterized protein CCR75_007820 [Bremia lactucae]|uniref:CAP-Gly domain-containing protein n=1 Tax=Bremia lactucae TaxID=4779 RepID=A0A976ILZ4_BRELC|nr:hypothetical protein CCR75_007820 [Bremia lactucae]
MPTAPLAVGDRVDDGCGSLGTIRYVGHVATAKDHTAIYYGVEWDVWGRGKNDGSVKLPSGERVVHFSGPPGRKDIGHGGNISQKCSFVKASSFHKTTSRSSLLERLLERYAHKGCDQVHPSTSDVVVAGEVGTTLGSEKPIELVGARKLRTQQTLETIEKISLSACQIVDVGGKDLGKLAPNLTELDLSNNLFSKWSDILSIALELPLLETLILSGNQFTVSETMSTCRTKYVVLKNLKVLVLNQTLLSWKSVQLLVTRHFPKLQELHLVGNDYEDKDLIQATSRDEWQTSLVMLDLSSNRLSSWSHVFRVVGGMFVNLDQLLLNNNCIGTLVSEDGKSNCAFQELTTLSVSENLIDSWTSIHALNAFPRLSTLRFLKNPLTKQMSPGEARIFIVARTDHIAMLNGSPVRMKERMEAEQLYLKRILHELAVLIDSTTERERVLAAHPRFARLCELYPEIRIDDRGNNGNGGSSSGPLKMNLLQVALIPTSIKANSYEPLIKKIPFQMTILQLKLLVEAKFGIEVSAQILSFRVDSKLRFPRHECFGTSHSIAILLDDDNAEVGYYGMQNQCEVLINSME